MPFVHPAMFFAALAALALPIAVHLLLRRRRRPVPWAAMRFLQAALRKQRRRLQLEQLLLLLLRGALVVLLGTALARPLLGGQTFGRAPRDLYIVVDDSLASAAVEPDGSTDLDRTRRLAALALESLDPARGDRATVLSLARPASPLAAVDDPARLAAILRDLAPSAASPDWPGLERALASALRVADPARTPVLLVLSALREGSAPVDRRLGPIADTPPVLLVAPPATAPRSTAAVAAVRPLRPVSVPQELAGPAGQVLVDLKRLGPATQDPATGRVSLTLQRAGLPGEEPPVIGEAVVTWAAGQSEQTVAIAPRWASADLAAGHAVLRAAAEHEQDALPADNASAAPLTLRQTLRVGIIGAGLLGRAGVADFGPERWAALALRPADNEAASIDLRPLHPADAGPATLADLDAAVLLEPDALRPDGWDELARLAQRGGVVLIAPAALPAAQRWPDEARRALGLDLEIAREPTDIDPPLPLAVDPAQLAAGPLALLAGELDALATGTTVSRHIPVRIPPGSDARAPLALGDSKPQPWLVVARARPGGVEAPGLVCVLGSAIALEWTTLPARPLFVPLVQELVRQGVAAAAVAPPVRAGDTFAWPPAASELVELRRGASQPRRANEPATPPFRDPGAFAVRGSDGSTLAVLTVNPDLAGASLTPRRADEVAAWLAPWAGPSGPRFLDPPDADGRDAADPVAAGLAAGEPSAPFDWPLLVIAGVLAVAETALARLASHAERETRIGAPA